MNRVVRTARFEEVAPCLACRLATPCEFLIFRKSLRKFRSGGSLQMA